MARRILKASSGVWRINLNTILFNLERKGFVRYEKRPVPGKKRMYHWQITIKGCGALMRARA